MEVYLFQTTNDVQEVVYAQEFSKQSLKMVLHTPV